MPGIHTEEQFQHDVAAAMVTNSGWSERPAADLDKTTRLIADDLFAFLEATQPKAVADLQKRAASSKLMWKTVVLDAVVKDLDKRPGQALTLLRHGKKILGVPVKFAYFKPAFGHNKQLLDSYAANRLTVVREGAVRKPNGSWGELDLVLCVNGIPVADAEMKNSLTGSGVDDAIDQYLKHRDHRDPLLRNRSVVHFAFDTDDVFMATSLGSKTKFLPFNRGSEPDGTGGRGNYTPADGSHPTSYLWLQIFQRDTFLDILNRFVHVEVDAKGPSTAPKMIFPRFHQWDAVIKLEAHAREHGPGHNYLVQHSAGSGKSNTIGWTAHRLANLHDANDERVFDKVVVITDRTILDTQLQGAVAQFERKDAKGKIVAAGSGAELGEALRRPSVRIVISTLQKFPFAKQVEVLEKIQGINVAVLVDEAHSSQTGDQAKQMKEVLTAGSLEEAEQVENALAEDAEGEIEAAIARSAAARKKQSTISMLAFTATPKPKTRELFGTAFEDADGLVKYRPFHLYSMRQAIEEGFILDVLRNYTTYDVYYRLATDSEEIVGKSRAAAAAARFASLHPHVLNQKVEIIVEHFREKVAHRIGGHAKAIIVTRSRLHAVRYKQLLDAYIAKMGYPGLHALVAFSGKVIDPDAAVAEPFTEKSMNGFSDKQTAKRFKGENPYDPNDYQVMVVAEKYQTGFDAPLLHTMYVDKPLKNVAAVQTLGRLNRSHPLKEDTFVLDFVNDADDIKAAFEPFFTTAVSVATDPQTLWETWQRVEDHLVVDADDVDAFAAVWFASPPPANSHQGLGAALAPAEVRFKALDEENQEEFRQAVKQFIRLYAFLAQVLPYEDTVAEKNFAYCKMLARRIAADGPGFRDLGDLLELTHVHAKKTGESDITLASEAHEEYAFTGGGDGSLTEEEQALLREVINEVNERFGKDLTDVHKIMGIAISEVVSDDSTIQEQAAADQSDEAFALGAFDNVFWDAILGVMEQNQDFGKELLDNTDLQAVMKKWIIPLARRRAREKYAAPELSVGSTDAVGPSTSD